MGSPLISTLAYSLMCVLEDKIMKEFRDKRRKSWMRYDDDTFVIVESRDNVEEILYMFNKLHKIFSVLKIIQSMIKDQK